MLLLCSFVVVVGVVVVVVFVFVSLLSCGQKPLTTQLKSYVEIIHLALWPMALGQHTWQNKYTHFMLN